VVSASHGSIDGHESVGLCVPPQTCRSHTGQVCLDVSDTADGLGQSVLQGLHGPQGLACLDPTHAVQVSSDGVFLSHQSGEPVSGLTDERGQLSEQLPLDRRCCTVVYLHSITLVQFDNHIGSGSHSQVIQEVSLLSNRPDVDRLTCVDKHRQAPPTIRPVLQHSTTPVRLDTPSAVPYSVGGCVCTPPVFWLTGHLPRPGSISWASTGQRRKPLSCGSPYLLAFSLSFVFLLTVHRTGCLRRASNPLASASEIVGLLTVHRRILLAYSIQIHPIKLIECKKCK